MFISWSEAAEQGSPRSCESSLPGTLNTTIAVIGGRATYSKTVINPFSAMRRLTF